MKSCSSSVQSPRCFGKRASRQAPTTCRSNRLRAGEVSTAELAELLSPSLFADERVVVLEAAAEAGKDAVTLIGAAAADLPPGTMLVVVHSGGGRAKALADQLKKLGAQVHPCARITKPAERADFVRREFRALEGQGRRRHGHRRARRGRLRHPRTGRCLFAVGRRHRRTGRRGRGTALPLAARPR